MAAGALGMAVIMLLFIHFVTWKIRAVSWLPNFVGTCIACIAVGGVGMGVMISGTVHGIFLGFALIGLGIPSLLFVHKYPQQQVMLKNRRRYDL